MGDIGRKIREDRMKIMEQNMEPKHVYLGQNEWARLAQSEAFIQAGEWSFAADDLPPHFLGFDIYVVMQKEHYVMTGE